MSRFFYLPVRAEWTSFENFVRVAESKANRVILETSSRSKISVEFYDFNVVRVRYAAKGVFERDFSYAFAGQSDRHIPKVTVSQTAKEIILTETGSICSLKSATMLKRFRWRDKSDYRQKVNF